MEWVEASGKSVNVAVDAALAELGLESRDAAVVEVLREPKAGFLGIGAQEALVKVSPKPVDRKRRRRRGRGKGDDEGGSSARGDGGRQGGRESSGGRGQSSGGAQTGRGRGDDRRGGSERSAAKSGADSGKPDGEPSGAGRGGRSNGRRDDRTRDDSRPSGSAGKEPDGKKQENDGRQNKRNAGKTPARRPVAEEAAGVAMTADQPDTSIEEQADVAVTFIRGLLEAYGLEGEVTFEIDEDILRIDVSGDQTEALVGAKGVVMQSVLEITRTVVQRRTFGAPRMRLDIAGYNERRRQALTIYATKLADKVLADGGEVMLEPMNPADRKVVHDAIGEIDGVRSFSEGEDPDRSVIISAE